MGKIPEWAEPLEKPINRQYIQEPLYPTNRKPSNVPEWAQPIKAGDTSTITGQPILSPEAATEKNLAGYQTALKTGLPIAGDIAMTGLAMSNPITAPAGIAAKAPLIAKYGTQGANLVMRMLASAGGSAGGSAGADLLTGHAVNMGDVGREASIGAGGLYTSG